ncbi:lipid-binding SYLF domain-containing protein [Magnetovibrio sp.]|uniref:lipid-binding SYLF domain-containing protein n=1 Tax=Magnetovibrio sp. TaxID=2024836 RepID=UPI002F926E0D
MALVLVAGLAACATKPMSDEERANQIVQAAQMTVEKFKASGDQPMDEYRALLPQAQGIVIFPGVIKGGFVFAAEGGSGVLLAKDASGRWGYPAFYLMASGSIGLQVGAQVGDVILLVFSQDAVAAIIESQGKLGADLGLIVGTVGAGVEASTTGNVGADVLAFTQGIGMFAGGSLEASALIRRNDLNEAFYGQAIGPADIVLKGNAQNSAADSLRAALDAQ